MLRYQSSCPLSFNSCNRFSASSSLEKLCVSSSMVLGNRVIFGCIGNELPLGPEAAAPGKTLRIVEVNASNNEDVVDGTYAVFSDFAYSASTVGFRRYAIGSE